MTCSSCGNKQSEDQKFCRSCGADLVSELPAPVSNRLEKSNTTKGLARDPDELTSNGIGSVIMGDGFLMVAVFLGVTHTAVSSLLWLLLLIPAFFFFGKGFADVLHAKQIQKRRRENELNNRAEVSELPPRHASVAELIKDSGRLISGRRASERTTRELQ